MGQKALPMKDPILQNQATARSLILDRLHRQPPSGPHSLACIRPCSTPRALSSASSSTRPFCRHHNGSTPSYTDTVSLCTRHCQHPTLNDLKTTRRKRHHQNGRPRRINDSSRIYPNIKVARTRQRVRVMFGGPTEL